MTHGAPLAVYDVWFPGEMVDGPAFSNWLNDVCGPRYAAVPKRHSNIDLLPSIGFERSLEAEERVPVPMTIEHLTDYLMTHSERIAAVRNGVETETQQQDFFLDGLREFYTEDRSREVLFGLELEVYQCV